MNNPQPIFLIGFMGSGKTTWGRKLAQKTGRTFIDLDEVITMEADMTIPEYFQQYGENSFRELESRVLKSLSLAICPIVATGGGTPCYFDNMAWMNKKGKTIYLYLPPKALWCRLMQTNIASRPALNGLSGMELLNDITAKLAARTPHYELATHVIDQLSMKLEDLVSLAE